MDRYDSWGQVPEHLRTKTQLADLDLPRIPGAEPVAYVYDRRPCGGRKTTFELYDLGTSLPSPASARQLEAARARQHPAARTCAECGAHPDSGSGLSVVGEDEQRRARLLCRTCRHIEQLHERLAQAAADRARTAEEAAAWLAADTAAVVHVREIAPPPGENGRPKRPIALAVGAVTPSGKPLAQWQIRLNKSRNPLVPAGAIPADDALPALREQLAGRDVIEWSVGSITPIESAFTAPREPGQRPRELAVLERAVARWRGEIDPRFRRLTYQLDPGRADLMALLIRRMAADHNPTVGTQ